MRHMTIVAIGYFAMRTVLPRCILCIHYMAVDAGFGIVTQIGTRVGYFKDVNTHPYKEGKFSTELQLHYYQSAADVKDVANPTKAMSTGLGTEAGIMFSYAFSPEMNISGGYSQMFGTETLQALKGGNRKNIQNWSWIMLTFNPTFFKSEK